jgi:hypothetical protein
MPPYIVSPTHCTPSAEDPYDPKLGLNFAQKFVDQRNKIQHKLNPNLGVKKPKYFSTLKDSCKITTNSVKP